MDTPSKVQELIARTDELSKEDKVKLDKLFDALMKIKDIVDQDELKNNIEAEVIIH